MAASRRGFLASLPAVAIATHTAASGGATSGAPPEPWLAAHAGRRHRQLFDVSVCTKAADPLRRLSNYIDVFAQDYAEPANQVGAIFGAHGEGLGYILDDAAWQKFGLSARFLTREPRTDVNPYRVQLPQSGWASDYSVTALQKKGVVFIACDRSLRRLSRDIAGATPNAAPEILAELRAHVLAGVELVPAMVAAICRAQEEHVSYIFAG